jgi:hypothetical protein
MRMAIVELNGDTLTVRVTGIDQVLAFKHTLEVPLEHVAGIDQDSDEAGTIFRGLRLPGTSLPGIVTAGSYFRAGEWSFWDVHDPRKAVIIRLKDEHYSRAVVGVDDPSGTIELVRKALARRST